MSRTRFSPTDIVGITLGALVALIVVGSVVFIAQGRLFAFRFSIPEMRGFWENGEIASGDAQSEENDQQVAGSFSTVEVRNVAGSIVVTGGGGAGIGVHSVKKAPTRAAMDNVRVQIDRQGDRLVIEEKHEPGFLMRSGSISFEISIPQGVKRIEARSVSGSVTVRDVEPGIDQALTSISGSISTSRARDLEASTTSGSIAFVFAGRQLDARSISGSIQGEIQGLDRSGEANLRTVSGSVRVGAFAGLDATVSLHSLSGPVSCDFPVALSEQRNNRLQGKIGGGAARVDIGTTSGAISVTRIGAER